MRRFLKKNIPWQIIILIKALGFLPILFIHFMVLPSQAYSKEAAILNTTIMGEIDMELEYIESQQRKLLTRNFNLLESSKVKAAHQSIEKIIGPGPCISAHCLRLMSQALGVQTLFVLRIKQINEAFQLSLVRTQSNEMHIVDDFCSPCDQEQFNKILTQLTSALIKNKGNYAKLILPLDLTLPKEEVTEMQIEMPVAPLDPLPPIDARLLYPSITTNGEFVMIDIQEIELPDPEVPIVPEAPKDLSELQSTQEDILIFPLSKDLVQEEKGEFIFQVSAFSEIENIKVNQKKQPSAPGIYEETIRVPYQLQPGENIFLVEVQTRLRRNEKEFIVFLETDKVKREKAKPSFQLIVISEAFQDDNFLSVNQESSKTSAHKGSLTLLSTYNKRFDHESRMALNALLMGDGYQEKALSDYAVLFKQISWDWFENFYFFPFELKTSLGINTVSMSDSKKTSSNRDPHLKDYKLYGSDQFVNLTGTTKNSESSSWKINLERKNKTNYDNSEQNGFSMGMSLEYQIKLLAWNHKFKLVNSVNDFQTNTNDYSEISLSYKFGIPLGKWKLTPMLKQSNTAYRVVNTDGVKKTSDKKNVSIELMYPLTGWMILSLTPQLEQGSSNTSETYQKNLGSFKMILIF